MPYRRIHNKILTILLCFSVFILANILVSPANAATIDQNGANVLQKNFADVLIQKQAEIEKQGNTLETSGKITVEPKGSYYAITFPALTFKKADGVKGTIAPISMNALPTQNPNYWNMSVAIPSSIAFTDAEDKPVMSLDVGGQRIGGVWNLETNEFAKFVSQFKDVILTSNIDDFRFVIGQMDLTTSPKNGAQKTLLPPLKIDLSDVKANMISSGTLWSLASATFNIDVALDPDVPNSFARKLQRGGKTFIAKTGMLDFFNKISGNSKIDASMAGLTINNPATSNILYNIGKAAFTYDMKKHGQNLADNKLDLSFSNLDASQSPNRYREILPENFKGTITLNNLPLADMLAEIAQTVPTDSETRYDFRVALLQSYLKFPSLFAQADTKLNLTETAFGNNLYQSTVKAEVKTSPQALIGIVGDGEARTEGFYQAIAAIEERAKTLTGEEKVKTLRGISALKFLADSSKDEGDVKITTIKLSDQMQILVNDTDIYQLIGRFKNIAPENIKR